MNAQLEAKIEKSKEVLRLARDMSLEYYGKPLVLTYSGGKDSDVMLDLAIKTLNPSDFEVINSHTSVDAPETVYHIREVFTNVRGGGTECTVHYPRDKDGKQITMWSLIVKRQIPPTRLARYCCATLKETSNPNRICAVGVRASESTGRKGRDVFATRGKTKAQGLFFSLEHAAEVFEESKDRDPIWDCTLIKNMRENKDIIVNPIYEWTDSDVWEYIRENEIKTNPLYERGYKRVGCIGCPMATYREMMKEFSDYPKFKDAYIRAFGRMLEKRRADGKDDGESWKDAQAVFDWWTERWKYECKGQMSLFDEENDGNSFTS